MCVCQEYGGLEFAPEEIKAQIVEMEQLSMTEVVCNLHPPLPLSTTAILGGSQSLQIPQSLTGDM